MPPKQAICKLADLQEKPTRSMSFNTDDEAIEGFLVVTGQGVRAYRNSCPHWGVELNWKPDEFFNAGLTHLMCSVHGALFNPDDGECIFGPCVRQRLEPLPITVFDGTVYYTAR